ncbi:MAG: hypothetical protein OXC01_15925 [Immundisolibacterales bacterium]|nr:hypothetical protein [Immundisolibacterales bacterium]
MTRIFKEHETMDPITNVSEREAVEKTNRLRSTLASGRIGRRDFMVTAIALGLSTTAASSVFKKAWAAAKTGGRLRTGTTGGRPATFWTPGSFWMPT